MGDNGSGIAGPEAKAGRVRPRETAGPREPWHIKKLPSYIGEQMEAQPRDSSLSFSYSEYLPPPVLKTQLWPCLHSLGPSPLGDPSLSIPPQPSGLPSLCPSAPPTTLVQVLAVVHLVVATGFSRILGVRPLCSSPSCARRQTKCSKAVFCDLVHLF